MNDDLARRLSVVLLTHKCAAWLPAALDRLAELGLPVVAEAGAPDPTRLGMRRPATGSSTDT